MLQYTKIDHVKRIKKQFHSKYGNSLLKEYKGQREDNILFISIVHHIKFLFLIYFSNLILDIYLNLFL